MALPLRKHKGMRLNAALEEARRRLEQVHLEEFADRYPATLSDGMRKRAAIARTLTLDPEVVLFDEPITGLDPVKARRIDALIRELSNATGVTSSPSSTRGGSTSSTPEKTSAAPRTRWSSSSSAAAPGARSRRPAPKIGVTRCAKVVDRPFEPLPASGLLEGVPYPTSSAFLAGRFDGPADHL